MQISALPSQRNLRDLSALADLCDGVVWMDDIQMVQSPDPAVLVGTWLMESPRDANRLIVARCEAGFATIVVPRWKPGNIGQVIAAPSKVEIVFNEFDHFDVDAGFALEPPTVTLPGQSIIKSPLHNGRWGTIKAGATILAFRPSEGSGAVVLCTAALTSQRFGVDAEFQRNLLSKLIERATGNISARSSTTSAVPEAVPDSIEDFIQLGNRYAAVVLATIVVGRHPSELAASAEQIAQSLRVLGMELAEDDLHQTLRLFPSATIDEMESALRQYGWSAYLRLARQAQSRFPRPSNSRYPTNLQPRGETVERQ